MTSTSIKDEIDKNQWVELICQQHHHLDRDKINDAFNYAAHLSETATSPYTTSTLEQGIKMANLLLDIGCDNATAIAALTYSSVYYAQPNREKLTQKLSASVAKLIYGATRMEAIHNMHRSQEALNSQQVDNLRKMLLAIVDDVRIVLIKLAERLITLQYLKKCNEEQQQYIANQAINFYAPLANRLGIGQLKWQIEDIALWCEGIDTIGE